MTTEVHDPAVLLPPETLEAIAAEYRAALLARAAEASPEQALAAILADHGDKLDKLLAFAAVVETAVERFQEPTGFAKLLGIGGR